MVQPILPVLRPDRLEDYFTRTFFTLVIIGAPLNMKRNLDSSQFNFKYNASMNKNKNGLHTERLVNGMKLEVNYKDGMKDGKWITWYENGRKWTDRNYKDGKEDGKSTEWFANGQIKTEENYKDGKKET